MDAKVLVAVRLCLEDNADTLLVAVALDGNGVEDLSRLYCIHLVKESKLELVSAVSVKLHLCAVCGVLLERHVIADEPVVRNGCAGSLVSHDTVAGRNLGPHPCVTILIGIHNCPRVVSIESREIECHGH